MILIGLGSSLPFCGRLPQEILPRAVAAIGRFCRVQAVSRLYASPAWPDPADPPFVNAVISVASDLSPEALLAALHAIEAGFGRRRTRRYGPRTLDLDLLDYHGRTDAGIASARPILPHPGLAERDFVLKPLAEIAPDWRHPTSGRSAAELLGRLADSAARPLACEATA